MIKETQVELLQLVAATLLTMTTPCTVKDVADNASTRKKYKPRQWLRMLQHLEGAGYIRSGWDGTWEVVESSRTVLMELATSAESTSRFLWPPAQLPTPTEEPQEEEEGQVDLGRSFGLMLQVLEGYQERLEKIETAVVALAGQSQTMTEDMGRLQDTVAQSKQGTIIREPPSESTPRVLAALENVQETLARVDIAVDIVERVDRVEEVSKKLNELMKTIEQRGKELASQRSAFSRMYEEATERMATLIKGQKQLSLDLQYCTATLTRLVLAVAGVTDPNVMVPIHSPTPVFAGKEEKDDSKAGPSKAG